GAILGGGYLLGRGRLIGLAGLSASQPFDLGDCAWCHDDAAPAARGEFEHGPDQAECRRLAGEAADDLRPPPDFDERALEQIRRADPLAVRDGEAQVADERV